MMLMISILHHKEYGDDADDGEDDCGQEDGSGARDGDDHDEQGYE